MALDPALIVALYEQAPEVANALMQAPVNMAYDLLMGFAQSGLSGLWTVAASIGALPWLADYAVTKIADKFLVGTESAPQLGYDSTNSVQRKPSTALALSASNTPYTTIFFGPRDLGYYDYHDSVTVRDTFDQRMLNDVPEGTGCGYRYGRQIVVASIQFGVRLYNQLPSSCICRLLIVLDRHPPPTGAPTLGDIVADPSLIESPRQLCTTKRFMTFWDRRVVLGAVGQSNDSCWEDYYKKVQFVTIYNGTFGMNPINTGVLWLFYYSDVPGPNPPFPVASYYSRIRFYNK